MYRGFAGSQVPAREGSTHPMLKSEGNLPGIVKRAASVQSSYGLWRYPRTILRCTRTIQNRFTLINVGGEIDKTCYIFIGDFVDRGYHSVETF